MKYRDYHCIFWKIILHQFCGSIFKFICHRRLWLDRYRKDLLLWTAISTLGLQTVQQVYGKSHLENFVLFKIILHLMPYPSCSRLRILIFLKGYFVNKRLIVAQEFSLRHRKPFLNMLTHSWNTDYHRIFWKIILQQFCGSIFKFICQRRLWMDRYRENLFLSTAISTLGLQTVQQVFRKSHLENFVSWLK